jgi:hypothetical protein
METRAPSVRSGRNAVGRCERGRLVTENDTRPCMPFPRASYQVSEPRIAKCALFFRGINRCTCCWARDITRTRRIDNFEITFTHGQGQSARKRADEVPSISPSRNGNYLGVWNDEIMSGLIKITCPVSFVFWLESRNLSLSLSLSFSLSLRGPICNLFYIIYLR